MSLEKWRIVHSAPHYLASNAGRIMVAPYQGNLPNGGKRSYGGEPTLGVWAKDAGRFITVYKGKSYKVHRLICEAWHGPAPVDAPVCIHIDENAANNAAENLRWGTQKENLNFPIIKTYQHTRRSTPDALLRAHEIHSQPEIFP